MGKRKKSKKTENYIRLSENSSKFAEYGHRVLKGFLEPVYYATEGDIGYFYYKELKPQK